RCPASSSGKTETKIGTEIEEGGVGSVSVSRLCLTSLSRLVLARLGHLAGTNVAVELLALEETKFEAGLPQRLILHIRFVSDLGRFVVADVRTEGGDEHEGAVHVLRNLFAVRLDAHHAVLGKGVARVAQQPHRVEEIVDDHRLEDVELKVALRPREGNRRVV